MTTLFDSHVTSYRNCIALIIAIVLCLFVGTLTTAIASVVIPSTHPRVLIDSNDLQRIRDSTRSYSEKDYADLTKYFDEKRESSTPAQIAAGVHPNVILPLTLVAMLSEDIDKIEYVRVSALAIAAIPATTDDDLKQRYRLLCMAIIYDWLYHHLSETDKTTIKASIVSHIRHLKYFVDNPLFTGGHSRFGSISILAGLIAIYGENSLSEESDLLESLYSNWHDGYNPFQSYAAEDGGYYMGWQYSIGYLSLWPYMLWDKTSVSSIMLPEWIRYVPHWIIYGLRPDMTFPRLGNTNDTRLGQDYLPFSVYSSFKFKDTFAEWLYVRHFSSQWAPYRVWRVLYRDPSVTPIVDKGSFPQLPSARLFNNSGVMVARSGWEADSTQILFKSAPFSTRNHHHRDQNHIEIAYKGSLLIDSGCYDSYGSSHWHNYYSRTIAHNTLIVHDPAEVMKSIYLTVSNDGGQLAHDEDPKGLTEALSPPYKLAGIERFASGSDYAYVVGNASQAYNTDKLRQYVRHVYIIYKPYGRNQPYIFVFDAVSLNKQLTPRILFHSNEAITAEGNYFSINNPAGGLLHVETWTSAGTKVELVGGEGNEWFVDGHNYPPSANCNPSYSDLGSWRAEVQPLNPVDEVHFISLLSIDDLSLFQGRPGARFVVSGPLHGVVSASIFIGIITDQSGDDTLRFPGVKAVDIQEFHLAGLISNKSYELLFDDGSRIMEANKDGIIIKPIDLVWPGSPPTSPTGLSVN